MAVQQISRCRTYVEGCGSPRYRPRAALGWHHGGVAHSGVRCDAPGAGAGGCVVRVCAPTAVRSRASAG
jgi:hypothetical protein